jgi:hypothetical protein
MLDMKGRLAKYEDREGIVIKLSEPSVSKEVWLVKFFEFGEVIFLPLHQENLTQFVHPTPLVHSFSQTLYDRAILKGVNFKLAKFASALDRNLFKIVEPSVVEAMI